MDPLRVMKIERTIVVASTFTAEPVRDSVQFWIERMEMGGRISFAPQNQLFQTLLDPTSPFTLNPGGLNVVLMRWEDLDHAEKSEGDRVLNDLIEALRACSARAKVPHLVIPCPASPSAAATVRHQVYAQWDGRLADEFAANPNIRLVTSEILQTLYPSASIHDSRGDRLALIPYSPAMFAALGTVISRTFHGLTTEPYKAIVADCDGTLWGGVCGEEGPHGVRLERSHLALQEFLVSQSQQGVLICLCSKNNEDDVEAVFRQRADMPLLREHLAASRINWAPKAENLKSIAEELGLGTESFIFLDDNPIECEAMRRSLPNVLTLQLPADQSDIPRWLRRVWAFDRTVPTNEDRKRTSLYQQERERRQLRKRSMTLGEFLAGLDLKVACVPLDAGNVARASQLTFRVNQFNLTTIRRTEGELAALLREGGLNGFTVQVSDRFGDYGLVGLVLYSLIRDALRVDTLLLSCRALNVALAIRYLPRTTKERSAGFDPDASSIPTDDDGFNAARPQRFASIACGMLDADGILAAIQEWRGRDCIDENAALVPASTELERLLVDVWAEVLGLQRVGLRDNFFSLGGDSLMMVRIIIRLYGLTGVEFPISAFFESPTIQEQVIKFDPLLREQRQ